MNRLVVIFAVLSLSCKGSCGDFETFKPGCVTVGGEIGRRMQITVDKMMHHTDVENTFARHFRVRKEKPDEPGGFAGYGMFLDALVKAAAHGIGGEEAVCAKTKLLKELGEMQTPDGRISMFSGKPGFWDNHEGAYMIQALSLDHRWFGTSSSLETARMLADSLIEHDSFPTLGSETAYLLLYEETHERKYLEWVERVASIADDIDAYGRKVKVNGIQHVYTWLARALAQLQYADVVKAESAERVRLVSAAKEAVRRAHGDYMSVTGSITGTPHWGELWDATQIGVGKWGETCASAYLMRLLAAMTECDSKAEYGDMFERVMYNAFFSAQSGDGLKYRYWTPFNERGPWYDRDTYCCPNNYKREVFELPDAVFFKTSDGLAVNLFSEAILTADGVEARMSTKYPEEEHVTLDVRMKGRRLQIRIPGWCEGATVSVAGGEPRHAVPGWFVVERDFLVPVRVDVELPMPIRLVPGTRAQEGRVAILRGPCVYSLTMGGAKGVDHEVDLWDLVVAEGLAWNAESRTVEATFRNRNRLRDRRRFSLKRYSSDVHDRTYFDVVGSEVDAACSVSADAVVTFDKPVQRWLWGGFGFHDSEATMLPIMSQEFRDERVYKTFLEISPTYARVFAGYADWTKEAMDSFADFYDATFRRAGTTIYMVPGRFPYIHRDFDAKEHFERVATNLAYLVNERKLTKLRYYAIANELSAGNVGCWFERAGQMSRYRDYCEEAYCAFRRHGLDIGLQTTDRSCADAEKAMEHFTWALKNLDEVTDVYCWHHYDSTHQPGEPGLYAGMYTNSLNLVRLVGRHEKRVSLGEFGLQGHPPQGKLGYGPCVMRDDGTFSFRYPDRQHLAAISQVEMALAAINAGTVSAVKWTLFDYPQPFLREDGDSSAEKARYDVSRFSGHGLQIRYNKCGLVAWNDEEHDYSARADLYTLGYLAKFFRKGGRILPSETSDANLIASGITQSDGSATYALINWGDSRKVCVRTAHPMQKPLRLYVYDSSRPPYNAFNDLQPASGTVVAKDGVFTVSMPTKSLVYATTDYTDRVPPAVRGVRVADGRLIWHVSEDPDHVYYRVYRNGEQVASTVATFFARVVDTSSVYTVRSVDRWGNVGNVLHDDAPNDK